MKQSRRTVKPATHTTSTNTPAANTPDITNASDISEDINSADINSADINSADIKSAKEKLLQHPDLWRAGQLAKTQNTGTQTGYAALDAHLPEQGWPTAGLVEFLLTSAGVGELRLLAPALKTLSRDQHRWIAWVNPPFIPYAPALEAVGININKILLIHPQNHLDTLWSIERACKSGTCSVVLGWADEKKLKLKDTQRLQVAAKQGNTLTCLFRPQTAQAQASMAELRLGLQAHPQPGQLRLDIVKRRGGWPVSGMTLSIAETTQTQHRQLQDITEQLSLWRAQQITQLSSAEQAEQAQSAPLIPFPGGSGHNTLENPVH